MTIRFSAYLAILAARDAALISLAILALAVLAGWLGVRVAFSARAQDRIILAGAIVYHITLLAVILSGGNQ
jgi:hypothetical protein